MWRSPASGLSLAPCQRGCVLEKPANCKQYVGLISLQLILAPCMGETSLGRELCSALLFPSRLQRAPTGLHQGPAPTPGGSRAGQAPPGVFPCHSCSPLTLITLCSAPPCPQTLPEMPMHNPGEQLVAFLGRGQRLVWQDATTRVWSLPMQPCTADHSLALLPLVALSLLQVISGRG